MPIQIRRRRLFYSARCRASGSPREMQSGSRYLHMQPVELSEGWQMAVPSIPKRSRLYSLEPMNVGTAEVESLTGYVARLAEAHCVTVSDLVGGELSDSACPTPLFTPDS